MAHTDTFYVSSRDNSIKRVNGNPISYFNPSWRSNNLGKAKYIIEVFGSDHENVAKQVRDMIDKNEWSDKLFHIKVETR